MSITGDALDKLDRYGWARDRDVDRDPRIVEITDDEAVAILQLLTSLGYFDPSRARP